MTSWNRYSNDSGQLRAVVFSQFVAVQQGQFSQETVALFSDGIGTVAKHNDMANSSNIAGVDAYLLTRNDMGGTEPDLVFTQQCLQCSRVVVFDNPPAISLGDGDHGAGGFNQ